MVHELATAIREEGDIMVARRMGRDVASRLAFSITDLTLIATAISEVARNILTYAGEGDIRFETIEQHGKRGILVTASDRGPGIEDLGQAMQDGFSSGTGLGLGLPGARRLMDQFDISSKVGVGTTVVMVKWVR